MTSAGTGRPATRRHAQLFINALTSLAAVVLSMAPPLARAAEPITIGFGMAVSGPLSPNGKQALLGARIWEEDINTRGGLLGRPVKLVYYDD